MAKTWLYGTAKKKIFLFLCSDGRTSDHRLHLAEIDVNLVHPLQGKEEEEKGRGREDDGNPGRNGGKEREEGHTCAKSNL